MNRLLMALAAACAFGQPPFPFPPPEGGLPGRGPGGPGGRGGFPGMQERKLVPMPFLQVIIS